MTNVTTDSDQFQYWLMQMDEDIDAFLAQLPPRVRDQLDGSESSLDVLEAWLLEKYPSTEAARPQSEARVVDGAARYVGEKLMPPVQATTRQERRRSVAMQRVAPACIAIVACLALVGCATRYAPSAAPDAGKLRVRMSGAHLFSSVATVLRPISNGQCGSPVSVPSIFPYSPPHSGTHHPAHTATATPPAFARAGMHGSTEASRSDSIELQVAPGRYIVALHGGLGTSVCSVSGAIDLQPHRQYEIEFRFDTVARKCLAAATRLDERDGRLQWVPQGMTAAPACA